VLVVIRSLARTWYCFGFAVSIASCKKKENGGSVRAMEKKEKEKRSSSATKEERYG
jgi:hypothetical protein